MNQIGVTRKPAQHIPHGEQRDHAAGVDAGEQRGERACVLNLAASDRGRERGEIPAGIDDDTAFELIEGPLIIRALANPAQLDDLDLDGLVETIIRRINA